MKIKMIAIVTTTILLFGQVARSNDVNYDIMEEVTLEEGASDKQFGEIALGLLGAAGTALVSSVVPKIVDHLTGGGASKEDAEEVAKAGEDAMHAKKDEIKKRKGHK